MNVRSRLFLNPLATLPMMINKALLLSAGLLMTAVPSYAQGDVTILEIAPALGPIGNSFRSFGTESGIAAYSLGLKACNNTNQHVAWGSTSGVGHPTIGQNVYRLKGRRFEQLGQSWLFHGFCALCDTGCGPRGYSGCAQTLRPGCTNVSSAGIMDGLGGGPKFTVNPTRGDHVHPDPQPVGSSMLRGRLQVPVVDVDPSQNQGAVYFAEHSIITLDDHQAGFAKNNIAFRKIFFNANSTYSVHGNGTVTHPGQSALHGWQLRDSRVVIQSVVNTDEGGSGVHGYYEVGSRAWDNGDGTWEYVYVVFNQNSTQGVDDFEIPAGPAINISQVWFNDVDYHSGELQNGTDWVLNQTASSVRFSCAESYVQNPDANAINWGTAYSFGFTADSAPLPGVATLGLFEPGSNSVVTLPLDGPFIPASQGSPYCFPGSLCPCAHAGAPDEGCPNSSFVGAKMAMGGLASLSADTLSFTITGTPALKPGLLLRGNNQVFLPISDGVLCVAGGSARSQILQTGLNGEVAFSNFNGAGFGSQANGVGVATYFQFWYRDPASLCGVGFNFSNAHSVTYTN